MYRLIAGLCMLILFAGLVQAQSRLSIRAASAEQVQGWAQMELDGKSVWVAPTASLTASDIARAQAITRPDGKRAISMELTDSGSEKMRALSKSQMDKLVAMVFEDKLIWAPRVRSEIGKQLVLTGNSPNGLSDSDIQRILANIGPR